MELIDLDKADAVSVVNDFYWIAKEYQNPRFVQSRRDYMAYHAIRNLSGADMTTPNVAIPKLFSVVESETPSEMKGLFPRRPYAEWEAMRKKDYGLLSQWQNQLLDFYLETGGFMVEMFLAMKIKRLYGTAFMEAVPYYETITEAGGTVNAWGGLDITKKQVERLRFRHECFAPWDIFFHPLTRNLEDKKGCPGLLKFRLMSKRDIIRDAPKYYPQMDLQKARQSDWSQFRDHEGYKILREWGLDEPQYDSDFALVVSLETPDRYADILNGTLLMRESTSNPFNHGKVNLSRVIHTVDPHTQNRLWGIGEAKPSEAMTHLLNVWWSLMLAKQAFESQPVVFFDEDRLNKEDLRWTQHNRIPVKRDATMATRPISDSFYVHSGTGVPASEFAIVDKIERQIDEAAVFFNPRPQERGAQNPTATEVMKADSKGSAKQEYMVWLAEQVFIKEHTSKLMSSIDQFSTIDDKAEVLGPEIAGFVATVNPQEIPGGSRFLFKGSGRLANQIIKQQNLMALNPIIQSTTNMPYLRQTLEAFDFTAEEIQEVLQWKQQEMMAQAQAAQIEAETSAVVARSKLNPPTKATDDTGAEQRGMQRTAERALA